MTTFFKHFFGFFHIVTGKLLAAMQSFYKAFKWLKAIYFLVIKTLRIFFLNNVTYNTLKQHCYLHIVPNVTHAWFFV